MGFSSTLYPGEYVVDDANFHALTSDNNPDHGRGHIARDWTKQPFGAHPVAQPFDIPLISRSEWDSRIEEMETTKSRLSDLLLQAGIKSKNQQSTNYCWYNGVITAMESIRCMMGLPYVPLSSASGACEVTNYRNVGGWGGDALEHLVSTGVCPESVWPNAAINRKYDTPESRAEREKYRVTEWYECRDRDLDQLMTLLFLRIPVAVGYNWWGHEVCACDPVKVDRGYGIRIRNSWGDDWGSQGFSILTQSKAVPDDAVAPRVAIAA